MEVSNATLVAYIDTLKEHHLDPRDLILGTSLDFNHITNTKEKISWKEFETITNNTFSLVGEEKALYSLRNTGVNNDGLSIVKKIGAATFRVEDIYWFFCSFVGKYFYKNLKFEYKKVAKGHVQITIKMNPGHTCFSNFTKAYASAFEGFPAALGLKPARAVIDQTEKNPIINLYFTNSFKLWNPFLLASRFFQSMQNTTKLLSEIEEKRHEQSLLNQELELLNNKLDSSNRLNETLIKAIMHDLNNPLAIIRLKNEKLLNEMEDFGQRDKEILNRATENMHNVIQELREFHLAKRIMCDDKFNILEILEEVQELFQEALEEKKLKLIIEAKLHSSTTLKGNRITFLNSILANIISNSIKFSFEGGEILIKACEEYGRIKISIIDNGTGMKTSAINNFFNNELCESEEGTSGELGLGVGLTQATYFTKEMGGEIQVNSRPFNKFPKNHGTEFNLLFGNRNQSFTLQ